MLPRDGGTLDRKEVMTNGYEDYFKGSKDAYIDFGGSCSSMDILKATELCFA